MEVEKYVLRVFVLMTLNMRDSHKDSYFVFILYSLGVDFMFILGLSI
jgi:hypothetical protein